MIIPPVCIEEGAHIRQSVVGPYVSIASHAVVEHSIISDSIINEERRSTMPSCSVPSSASTPLSRRI